MHGVEPAGFLFRETHRLDGDNLEACFVDAGKDFALKISTNGIRLDDCECALECHEKSPPVNSQEIDYVLTQEGRAETHPHKILFQRDGDG
jgi:hypothetical protein